jgi:hypothetical protein
MGVDERRRQQASRGIELVMFGPAEARARRDDARDPVVLGQEIDESTGSRSSGAGGRIGTRIADEQTRGGFPPSSAPL